MKNEELTGLMNGAIGRLVGKAMKIALSDFSAARSFVRILKYQKKAAKIRLRHEAAGLHVPPFLIASIVRACNLRCKGCYDRAKHEGNESVALRENGAGAAELDAAAWKRVFSEARELGVSFILLAGGEPFLRRDIILECKSFPEIVFPVFTNGLLIDDTWIDFFSSGRNVIPIVSVEGDEALTDKRRGSGVHAAIIEKRALLKSRNILYGLSITLTSENFNCVLSEDYIDGLVADGARIIFFVEYIPFDAKTDSLVLGDSQKAELPARLERLHSRFQAIFLDFPGDEAAFGGCLASGRGFVHINATGSVESCPFAPYSDSSIANRSLSAALGSPVLSRIRSLQETLGHSGGCTLFENKAMIEDLLKKE